MLCNCLRSMTASVGDAATLEVIVVDNESTDDTQLMLAREFPGASYVRFEPGVGFSRGINAAVSRSKGEFIMLGTPSTEILGQAIPVLLDYLIRHQTVGVVGPKVLNPDGSTQHSSKKMPTPKVAMLHTLHQLGLIAAHPLLKEYFLLDYESDEPLEVTSLTMSLMLARRRVFDDVGPLDDTLFAWSSDVDWCYRVEHSRWGQVFLPTAKVVHRRSSVSKKEPFRNLRHYHRDLRRFYQMHYAAQHGPLVGWLWEVALQARFVAHVAKYMLGGSQDYSFY